MGSLSRQSPALEVARVVEHAATKLHVRRPIATQSQLVERAYGQSKKARRFSDVQQSMRQIGRTALVVFLDWIQVHSRALLLGPAEHAKEMAPTGHHPWFQSDHHYGLSSPRDPDRAMLMSVNECAITSIGDSKK